MMSELRWTLLILGVVFIAVLAWWERRRPRQASGALGRSALRDSVPDNPPRAVRDPPMTLPELHPRASLVGQELPIVEIAPETAMAWRAPAGRPELAPAREEPMQGAMDDVREAADEAAEWHPAAELHERDELHESDEPQESDEPHAMAELREVAEVREIAELREVAEVDEAADASAPVDAAVTASFGAEESAAERLDAAVPTASPGASAPAAAADGDPALARGRPRELLPELPPAAPMRVEWPNEGERRIVALRLVAPQTERFPGRSLRQALAAEGFLLGQFAIFHKPDDERRAVLSAASLSRPGTFDMETMDSQHYGGLSLFAVLPGPKPPPQAFDELVFTARNLNDRLHGVLQDEHGAPLTPARIAQLREQLRSGTAS